MLIQSPCKRWMMKMMKVIMMMMISLLSHLSASSTTFAFSTTVSSSRPQFRLETSVSTSVTSFYYSTNKKPLRSMHLVYQSSNKDDNGSRTGTSSRRGSGNDTTSSIVSNWNPLYGGLWIAFLTFGLFLSPGQIGDSFDTQLLQTYIDNPTAPEGINPLFLIIFNGLGVMPLIIAQLACPQGNKAGGGIPAAPFLAASMAMGFGAAGFYLTFRAAPVETKTQTEASWFTRSILENKLVSLGAIGLLGATVASAMAVAEQHDGGLVLSTVFSDYVTLVSQSKFVSVSSLDLLILTIAAATLIPRDLQLRTEEDINGSSLLGRNIALATMLFPILGAALYCLWRPRLPVE